MKRTDPHREFAEQQNTPTGVSLPSLSIRQRLKELYKFLFE